ncbi:hypothetical protein AS149_12835 [Burkholderia cenocepacia]|nr:hypothetical protein AS149_12835 [Burkholderia cenocepacia]
MEATLDAIGRLNAAPAHEAQRAVAALLWRQMNELLLAAGREHALSNGWVSVRRSLTPLSNDEFQWPVLVMADSLPDGRVARFYGRKEGYRLHTGEHLDFADVKLWRASPKDSEIGVTLVAEIRKSLEAARDHDLARYDDSPTAFAMRAIAEDAWNKAVASLDG